MIRFLSYGFRFVLPKEKDMIGPPPPKKSIPAPKSLPHFPSSMVLHNSQFILTSLGGWWTPEYSQRSISWNVCICDQKFLTSLAFTDLWTHLVGARKLRWSPVLLWFLDASQEMLIHVWTEMCHTVSAKGSLTNERKCATLSLQKGPSQRHLPIPPDLVMRIKAWGLGAWVTMWQQERWVAQSTFLRRCRPVLLKAPWASFSDLRIKIPSLFFPTTHSYLQTQLAQKEMAWIVEA